MYIYIYIFICIYLYIFIPVWIDLSGMDRSNDMDKDKTDDIRLQV